MPKKKNPWMDDVHKFNKNRITTQEKATDLDILVAGMMKLNRGQLKNVLSEEVLEVLHRNGYVDVGT